MARANHDKKIPIIQAEWRTGEYSQRELAVRHEVSPGFVAKWTFGIARDAEQIVSAGVLYKQALAADNEHLVSAVSAIVDEKTKHLTYLNKAAMKNVSEAMSTPCGNQADYKMRGDTIKSAKETIFGKAPDVQVNTQINSATNTIDVSKLSDAAKREILNARADRQ